MEKINVAVVGDVCLDCRRYGTSTRTSPEDRNCKVLTDVKTVYELGMAGNVAAWLAAQDRCEVALCGMVGGDTAGYHVMALCESRGVLCWFPDIYDKTRRYDLRTTVKERICVVTKDRIQQLVRCDRDMRCGLDSNGRSRIIEEIEKADLVVVADYNKGVFGGEHGAALRQWIGENLSHKTVVVNSKTPNAWEGLDLDALICNQKEAIDALCERGGERTLNTKNYIVTCGKEGVIHYPGPFGCERYRSQATNVVDVTGAGDAFTAGFALEYHLSRSVTDAIGVGQEWAADCCARIGCGAPSRE